MPTILGIDPGSRQTGYGLLYVERRGQPAYVHSGVVCTRAADLPGRLAQIFEELTQLIQQYHPDEVAVEQIFLAHNVGAALKLGQARGAAIVAAVQYDLPLFEYSAKQIKQAAVGYGAADKRQMQLMMRHHLKIKHMPQSDEADALGVAWCHAQARSSPLIAGAHQAAEQTVSEAKAGVNAGWQSKGRRGAALRKWAGSRAGNGDATTNAQASVRRNQKFERPAQTVKQPLPGNSEEFDP
jgi:crossover junction endodeoxyribonuclease RuvC